ncbi:MAG: DUF4235 domain-containing protein [Nocardioidaceae bacterium]|nr:DUF4235 domain-containing protein [Nocardioidaceae bacterium]
MATKSKVDEAKAKKAKGKRAWKMLGSGSALVAGVAVARLLDAAWATATGHKPPTRPENPDIGGREAMLWAAVSGMAIGVAKTYATRRAAQYWVKSTGEVPPGMLDEGKPGSKRKLKRQAT